MIQEAFNAARFGEVSTLKELLNNNPDLVNTENNDGLTLLGFAAHFGHAEAVKLLMDNGANVNALSHSRVSYIPSNTALHAAIAGERNVEVIQLLLAYNADVNLLDSNGHTSLHTAAFHQDNGEMIKLLLSHGADVHVRAADGKTALELARERRNNQVVELLEQKGGS